MLRLFLVLLAVVGSQVRQADELSNAVLCVDHFEAAATPPVL